MQASHNDLGLNHETWKRQLTYNFLPGAGDVQGLAILNNLTRKVRDPVMSIRDTCGKPPSMPLTVDGVLFQ